MASRDEQSDTFLSSDAVNEEFFIDIIEKKLKIARDKFKLRLVLITPATGKNENFVCVVYRAKIKILLLDSNEIITTSVIIKALLSLMQEFKEFSVFPRERLTYENIITSFEKIWSDVGEDIQFAPRCLRFDTDPYEMFVMEDLQAMGYKMLDRKIGANKEQTNCLISKLAKFHAASAIRYRKDGVIKDYLDRNSMTKLINDDHPMIKQMRNMHGRFVKALYNFENCKIYADKISKWDLKKFSTLWMDISIPMRCGFVCLSHGDIWLNNMMFKSEPHDVIMYDYQGSSWATPANDLLYFIVSSVCDEDKVAHFDDFIEYYHLELCKALKELAYDHHIPTLSELFIDIMEKGQFAAMCLMFILTIVKNESSEEVNLEMIMGQSEDEEKLENMYKRIYENETYKKAVTTWLPFLNKRGFLDSMLPADL